MQTYCGHLIRILHCCSSQVMTAALADMELTAAQGRILGYLAHCQTPPCPRDIEEFFGLSHPSVSGTLSRMQKKGFLEFRPDEIDRRSKRIYLLPKGKECHDQIMERLHRLENTITDGFSPEETAQFSDFLNRAMKNVGVHCPKKEDNNL